MDEAPNPQIFNADEAGFFDIQTEKTRHCFGPILCRICGANMCTARPAPEPNSRRLLLTCPAGHEQRDIAFAAM